MFEYFPGNYTWSAGVNLALMCGGELGEIHHSLARLRDAELSGSAWLEAWTDAAELQERRAQEALESGYRLAAGEAFLRACLYHGTGERQAELGPAKAESYAASLRCFASALECGGLGLYPVQADSPDGPLPGYVSSVPGRDSKALPAMIYVGGFDVTKEMLFMMFRGVFERRGIRLVVVDTPGIGEPLRLHGVPSRPDYEVPVSAFVDALQRDPRIDGERIGVMGISLGGYYAPRAAAYEPRLKCCVALGAILDYGATWEKRWREQQAAKSVPWFQLPWVMGTDTMESALERVREFDLTPALADLKTPFLLLHGANDRQIPVVDAERLYELAASEDKTLIVYPKGLPAEEHCQVDDPSPARELIGDWCASRLRAEA
jgi:dienelactone hydrolase